MPLRQLADVAAILAELDADSEICAGKKLMSLVQRPSETQLPPKAEQGSIRVNDEDRAWGALQNGH
jgi:hypothetical protein